MIEDLEVVTVNEDEFIVTWFTDTPSDTRMEYGTNGEMDETYSDNTLTSYHGVAILGLSHGTNYSYRVGSGPVWSEVDNFTTLEPPSGEYLFSFAMAADTHYRDDNVPNTPDGRMLEESDRLSLSLVNEINERDDVEFTIIKGDMTDGGDTGQFAGFKSKYNKLKRPWYPLLGNHDKFSADWEEGWQNASGRNTTYYSFLYSRLLFIVLDSAQYPYRNMGSIPEEQLEWLDELLENNSKREAFIFLHHMVVLDEDSNQEDGLENDDDLISVISKHENVVCVNSGHKHQNKLSVSQETGDVLFSTTASIIEYPIGYSIVRVYENGYTQAFYKVISEMELSQESRERQRDAEGNLGTLEQRSFKGVFPEVQNTAPIIDSIDLSLMEAFPGDEIDVHVEAHDIDGDEMDYHYSVEDGKIIGSGKSVIWHTPSLPGTYSLTVRVDDGSSFSSSVTEYLEVFSIEDAVLEISKVVIEPTVLSKGGTYHLSVEIESSRPPEKLVVQADLSQIGGLKEQTLSLNSSAEIVDGIKSIFSYEGTVPASTAKGDKIISISARAWERQTDSQIEVRIDDEEGDNDRATPGFLVNIVLISLCTLIIAKNRKRMGF